MRIGLLGVVLLGLASACVVRVDDRPVRRGVVTNAMGYDEAVSIGSRDCQARGYVCFLKEAHETGDGLWKVKFEVERAGARGHLHLEYDRFSRALVRVDENVHGHEGEHGHEHMASPIPH